nr:imidazole glycerol phosphate synthase subunit HisH [uncultured Solibaculum sp.]
MISIVDYGAGNLQSVRNAFSKLGADTTVATAPDQLKGADALILPGVGAFGDAMEALSSFGFPDAIREFVKSGKPFLGICLGMQLLLDSSEESPGVEGLHILKGTVRRFPSDMGLKVPHIGFNSIVLQNDASLFHGLGEHPYYYFVHSYYCSFEDPKQCAARAEYGLAFDAAAQWGNVFATQFHPEKSGVVGLHTLQNFLRVVEKQ